MNSASQVDVLFSQWKSQGLTKETIVVNLAKAEIGWPYGWGAVNSMCTPSKRQYYSKRSQCPAKDAENLIERCQVLRSSSRKSSCSGCQFFPNDEETGLNDCQGWIKQLMQFVGISLAGGGCTTMWDNDSNWSEKGTKDRMPNKLCLVFQYNKDKYNMQHVGLHIGDGVIIECSGTVKYSNITKTAWTHYAMVRGLGGDTPMPTHATIRRGSTGADVVECQKDLISLGYDLGSYGADGKFGAKTEAAVKEFQRTHVDPNTGDKLKVDGIVGPASWAALDAAVGPSPTPTADRYTVTIPHLTLEQANALIAEYPAADKKKE